MDDKSDVREAFSQLLDNLGMIGSFMLREVWSLLRMSWGASREEFLAALDKVKKNMIESGKWAADDIEKTSQRILQSWDLLNEHKDAESKAFFSEVRDKLEKIGSITKENFDAGVTAAKETLDSQWKSMGKLGEDQIRVVQEQTGHWADALKGQWDVVKDNLEKTGKKVDRAISAALDELKKKD
jgi:hypothetical protein